MHLGADEYHYGDQLRSRLARNLAAFPDRRAVPHPDRAAAAVAVCIVPDAEGRGCFVLTRRVGSLRSHAGQWALPGGRLDAGEMAEEAACREMAEEVGLHVDPTAVLSRLDDYPTRSGYVITPVVLMCDEPGAMQANPGEVASIHLVPLSELDHPEAPRLISIPESPDPVIQMPLMGEWIHAPTGAILLQLRDVALHGVHTRVDHFDQPTWAWR